MSKNRGRKLSRGVALALPLLTVGVLGFSMLGPGAERSYGIGRLAGGPTDGTPVAIHVEVVERLGEVEAAQAETGFVLELSRANGTARRVEGRTDPRGHAYVTSDLPGDGPVRMRLQVAGRVLAEGEARVTTAQWERGARIRGGWLNGQTHGELSVRAAALRGVFAVPFPGELVVEVSRAGSPLANAAVTVRLEDDATSSAVSDASGRATFTLTPKGHAPSLEVKAQHGERQGSFVATLPVLPGAFDARSNGSAIRVSSPVNRDVAYVALLSPKGRLAHTALPLVADGRGGALGEWSVATDGATHVLVSSEPDFRSPAAVGWPLSTSSDGAPATTLAVADMPFIDGGARGHAVEAARRRHARLLAGIFVVAAGLLAVALLALESRRAGRNLDAHLLAAGNTDEDVARLTSRRIWPFVALSALAAILLGFAIIGLVVLATMNS